MRTEQEVVAQNKKTLKRAALVVVALIAFFVLVGALSGGEDTTQSNKQNTSEVKESDNLVDEVEAALGEFDEDMQSSMAATSIGGYQGEIVGVEADGDDGVIVKVSTYYSEPGEEDEGGKNIARKIFSNICLTVPELDSLYVTSTSSGLDSQSVYRSETPGCKQ